MDVLAKRLKWLREKERYSQKDIADKIGMSPSGYQKIERAERDPKLDVLAKLCEIFNVSSDFLIGINDIEGSLQKIVDKFFILNTRKSVVAEQIQIVNIKLQEIDASGILRTDLREEFNKSESMLQETKKRLERNQYLVQEEYREIIFQYIKTLLEIPHANFSRNHIIKMLRPFSIEIQPNIFDEFSLAIFCKDGFVENYEIYQNEEEALEARRELLTILNGKLH